MPTIHNTLTGTELHYPLGHSTAGVLTLAGPDTAAYRIESPAGAVMLGMSTATGNYSIAIGNNTDNPALLFGGSGPWAINLNTGTSGQVLTSGGSGTNPTWDDVTQLQGNAVETGTPTDGDVLTWSTANSQWEHTAPGAGSGNTLDQAYDQGGAGAGRTITADSGAVTIAGTSGFTISGGPVTFSGSNVDFDPTGTWDVSMDANQQCRFTVSNSYTNAFQIVSHGRVWFEVSSGISSAGDIQIGNTTDTPSLTCQVSDVQFTNGTYVGGYDATDNYRYFEGTGGGADVRVCEDTFRFSATTTSAETIYTCPVTPPTNGVGRVFIEVIGIYNNGGTRVSSADVRGARFENVGGTLSLVATMENDSSQDNAGATDVVLTTDGTDVIIQGTAPDAAYEWSGYIRWMFRPEA